MPNLTQDVIKTLIDKVNSSELQALRKDDYDRWIIYNGGLRHVIMEAIKKEFKKPETILSLGHRLTPLNIVHKIINKLSMVYKESPIRRSQDNNEADNELVSLYTEVLSLNQRMKESNKSFKLHKRALLEIYLDETGYPSIRCLPRHTYEVFSHSVVSPEMPDTIIKIINSQGTPEEQTYQIWTDDQFLICCGKGQVKQDQMLELNNPDGINPYGILPFVYINESSFSTIPIPDDDLLRMGIVIPIILSDLALGSKYQAWSLLYTIGVNGELPSSPNSVINLDFGPNGEKPEIGMVRPDLNIDGILRLTENYIATLLTTKNLSVSAIAGKLDVQTPSSGIAKMLDQAESIEDRQDQQQYFIDAEKELWFKLSDYIIPYWRSNGLLEPELNKEFSSNFEISVQFIDPKIILTDKEKIETAQARLNAGLSTKRRELQYIYPNMNDTEIDQLLEEINKEKQENMERFAANLGITEENEEGNEDNEEIDKTEV